MGGFWSNLGQGMLAGVAQQSPLGKGIYNAYQSNRMKGPKGAYSDAISPDDATNIIGGATPTDPGAPPIVPPENPNAGMDSLKDANDAAGLGDMSKPNAGLDASMANTMPDAASMATMSPWNQPSQSGGGGGLQLAAAAMGLAKGKVVTHPMIAKIGESGPEAVIPLTPRAGNRMQPDVLEGHVAQPRVPGVKYSRYKSFNRLAPGASGEI